MGYAERSSTIENGANGMRVATWNLWWRFGKWEERSRVIQSALADAKFDVCALSVAYTRREFR